MSATAAPTRRAAHGAAPAPARPRHEPAPAPRRHLRPVPDVAPARSTRTRRRVRPQVALTMAIGALFLILFAVALLQTVLVQGQLRLDGLRADVAERQTEARELRNAVAEMESPANLRQRALENGMTESGPPPFVVPPPEAAPADS